uniref:Uncharacterized protein n=1 Tax=Nelumbo nucifera TaxID=4432 RepID=A0A822XN90_NELNU|nr:TPA_asm: hypothetical protein HUJ06_024545 [Nelumbo nucifera]DAD23083.1 TPA_asm: hypothetical protein HUJ06_024546 [Nelumbo nucifera]DAD23084.1 TPA_asm: hypothetical protein HUJ06_024547 [Nelumbo nucifera]
MEYDDPNTSFVFTYHLGFSLFLLHLSDFLSKCIPLVFI